MNQTIIQIISVQKQSAQQKTRIETDNFKTFSNV